ncbi:MAG: DNA-processing protein DprA [Hydrogenothermaceae bacterium]
MLEREIAFSLALSKVKGIGYRIFKILVEKFGSATLAVENIHKLNDISKNLIQAVESISDRDLEDGYRQIEKANKLGVKIVPLSNSDYPKLLKEIPDPPPILYVKGNFPIPQNTLSVVGTRNPSVYGKFLVENIVRPLAKEEVNIVSGLAFGIDSMAHKVALEEGSFTTAVLGHGIDFIFPSQNKGLYEKIVSNGCLISEFPLGTKPSKYTFPQRNRVIAGISYGTIVLEAGLRSGSLITAKYADGYSRVVFTPPGNLNQESTLGNNLLIKQGIAIPILSVDDIFKEVPFLSNFVEKEYMTLTDVEEKILSLLTSPKHIDQILEEFDFNPEIDSILLEMTLKGIIKEEGGFYYRTG